MTNYILFWEAGEAWDAREWEPAQRAKELLKVYRILDGAPAGFVTLDCVDTRKYKPSDEDELARLLGQLSDQVQYEEEWRLIVFLMRDVDLPCSEEDFGLTDFLACVMGREEGGGTHRHALNCERPEHIWLITLAEDRGAEPPELLTAQVPVYGAYPPNCRFLRYSLDFKKENLFSREMLKLHCGVGSLARNYLPADILRGDRTYWLSVELEEGMLCDWVHHFRASIRERAQALRLMERQPPQSLSVESAPPVVRFPQQEKSVRRRLDNVNKADSERGVKRLREEADRILEEDGREERTLLLDEIKRLRQWEEEQGRQIITPGAEKRYKEESAGMELEMLPLRKPERDAGRAIRMKLDSIFNLRTKLNDLGAAQEREEMAEAAGMRLEREYQYAAETVKRMKKEWRGRIGDVMLSMLSCLLFVLSAVDQTGALTKAYGLILSVLLPLFLSAAVYWLYFYYFYCRRGSIFKKIKRKQVERVIEGRRYFNMMCDYVRLNRVLNYHQIQRARAENAETALRKRKAELESWKPVCSQLEICCLGLRDSGKKGESPEMIRKPASEESGGNLYRTFEEPPVLTLNGNSLTAAFPFVRSIRLREQPRRMRKDGAEGRNEFGNCF